MTRAPRVAAWIALAALSAVSAATLRERAARAPLPAGSVAQRLFGPIASLAASVQWVRADSALRDGREALGYARAESALQLDPRDAQGWIFLAHHLIFDRASLEHGEDAGTRALWVQAGLELLQRGESAGADPAALAFDRGLVFVFLGSLDDADRAFPASAAEAWAEAATAFERARALGHPLAREAALGARKRAE